MPLEFRDLLIESIRVQEQWVDLGERLHTHPAAMQSLLSATATV